MKKTNRTLLTKSICIFITFLLVFTSLPLHKTTVSAEEYLGSNTNQETPSNVDSSSQDNQPTTFEPNQKGKEVVSMRTETAKVYENLDGTYTSEVFLEPIHFKKDEKWVDIDNTIYENAAGEFENKSNKFKVKFPKKPKENSEAKLFTYEIDGHVVEVEFIDSSKARPNVHNGTQDINGTLEKDKKVKYKDLYSGVTFDYVVDGTKIKENIILDSYRGKNIFEFHIKAQGLKAEKKESGLIEFTDEKTGKFVFFIQRPYMYDSATNPEVKQKVTQEINSIEDGFLLTVTADEEYLTSSKRVYPVVIDPWIDVFEAQDTFVSSNNSTSNYGNLDYLSVGNNGTLGKTRTYARWDLPYIPNARVTQASLGVYQYSSGADIPVYLHRVTNPLDTSTVKWSTQPTFEASAAASKSGVATGYNYFLISDLVKGWYDNTFPNYGVVLKYADAQEGTTGAKLFRSAEWNSTSTDPYGKPKLVITYRSKNFLGITDYWEYTPDLINGDGRAIVNVINGNMVYDIPILSLPGKTNAFDLKLVYNSRSGFEDVVGYRWTFSAQRKLIPNYDKTIVEYIDENGTHYHFNKQQHDTGTSYSSPEGKFLEFNSTSDGGFTLKEPDETLYYFDGTGRNTKTVDEKGNIVVYTFDGTSNRIIKISERFGTETTGRDISLSYDSVTGLLKKIIDFRGSETVFDYGHSSPVNRLDSITYAANRPEQKRISFTYDNNHQLTSVIDANGNIGKFEYDALSRVSKIIDPRSDSIFSELIYPSPFETIFKDANGGQTYFKNNGELGLATVNVVEKIEDYQGTNPSSTLYEWKNNEVVKVIEPNKDSGNSNGPTTLAEYDEKGNLKTLTTTVNEIESNQYDNKSNLTGQTTNTGLSIDNVYDFKSNLLFSTNHAGLTDYQSYDRYGNIVSSVSTTSGTYNLVSNSNFETVDANSLPVNWGMRAGGGYSVPTIGKFGNRSAKMSLTGTEGYRYYYQNIPISTALSDKTFTVSGFLKTENVTGVGAQIVVYFKDTNDQFIRDNGGNAITYTTNPLKGSRDWVNISQTFIAPSNTAYVQVLLNFDGAGSAYFDGVQLNQGNMSVDFVSNENESFEAGTATTLGNWTLNSLGTGDGKSNEQSKSGQYSAKLTGVSTGSRYLGQLVQAKGKSGDAITISGWAYVKSPNTTGDFSLQATFVYTDGTEGKFTVPFDTTSTNKWQFLKKTFRAGKDFSQIKIYAKFNNQAGTVYFDNIKAEERAATSSATYSADGNFVQGITNAINQTTTFEYNANGNQTSLTTHRGNRTIFGYDYLNQLTLVTQEAPVGATNITVGYKYDAQGNLKERTDPRNHVTAYEYNALNQVTKEIDPLEKIIRYDYDSNGNLNLIEKGKGTTTLSKQELKYNHKNQLSETWINGQKVADYQYDFAGNVKSVQYQGQTYSFGYDAFNRLTSIIETSGYKQDIKFEGNISSPSYGLRSELLETFGGSSYKTTTGYDTLQRLSSLTTSTGAKTELYYNEKSQPIQIRFLNNGSASPFSLFQSYDELGRYKSQHLMGSSDLDLKYEYDSDANLQTYFDGIDNHSYTYDFANRLESWTYKGQTVNYNYDTAGNLKNPNSKTLTFNAANEIDGFTYDEAGNLLKDDKYQYEWDGEGRLITVKDLMGITLSSYTYFSYGLRKTKTVGPSTFSYHYDGSDLIRITDQNNQTVWAFTWINGRPNTVTNSQGQTFFYITNYRGDVVRIVDGTGVVVANYSYDPWGNVSQMSENTSVANQPIGYAGYFFDRETNLYYLQARYYDPATARFISRDAYEGDVDSPVTQNPYVYANNNPLIWVDPDGNRSARKENPLNGIGGTRGPVSSRAGGKAASKPINLPSYKKVNINMGHIMSGHSKSGGRATQSKIKSLFPRNMSQKQIENAIRNAYRHGKRVQTQGDRVKVQGKSGGMTIEMWVNTKTKRIETAYPK